MAHPREHEFQFYKKNIPGTQKSTYDYSPNTMNPGSSPLLYNPSKYQTSTLGGQPYHSPSDSQRHPQTTTSFLDHITSNSDPRRRSFAPIGKADADGRYWGHEIGYATPAPTVSTNVDTSVIAATATVSSWRNSLTTPGVDNLSQNAPGGGIPGLAYGVANTNDRDGGLDAMSRRLYLPQDPVEQDSDYSHFHPEGGRFGPAAYMGDSTTAVTSHRPHSFHEGSHGTGMSSFGSPNHSERTLLIAPQSRPQSQVIGDGVQYSNNNPYRTSIPENFASGDIDPECIADDGDDGLAVVSQTQPDSKAKGLLGFGARSRAQTGEESVSRSAASSAATAETLSSIAKHKGSTVVGESPEGMDHMTEKSEWLNRQASGNKRLRWIVGSIVVLVIIGVIVGAIVGVIMGNRNNASPDNNIGISAEEDDARGDLGLNSQEIKDLLDNENIHKVFPGVAYTPINSQYPDCVDFPPSQNNVTRDLAVLSQMTNRLRLYGNDCNQTQMVLHAMDRLELSDMKIWLGTWLDDNEETNTRQKKTMWEILEQYDEDLFAGVVVGNEVLYREDMTQSELIDELTNVKEKLEEKGLDLLLATSDLGDNWTEELTEAVDVVMSNVHPFFSGVTAEKAAGWTWDFWTTHDKVLAPEKLHMISEVGWPSDGGNACGVSECTSDTQGSVAGIEGINTLMENWVCEALSNGTEYFWFEAFDEPWKVSFNEEGKEWEDKWGLMDVNRVLKDGIKIPNCGDLTL